MREAVKLHTKMQSPSRETNLWLSLVFAVFVEITGNDKTNMTWQVRLGTSHAAVIPENFLIDICETRVVCRQFLFVYGEG